MSPPFTSTDSNYVKFTRYNLEVSHHLYVCNFYKNKMIHTESVYVMLSVYLSMFMIYLHAELTNRKLNINFIWLWCWYFTSYEKNHLNRNYIFFKDLMPHKISEFYSTCQQTYSYLQLHTDTMMVFLMTGKYEVQRWSDIWGHDIHTNFTQSINIFKRYW
jgi:uncharacterized membrane protein